MSFNKGLHLVSFQLIGYPRINVLQKALLIKKYLVQSSLITTNSKTFRIIQYFFMLRPPALHKEAVAGTPN